MKIFTGWDQREAIGWHVFAQSVIETTPGAEIVPLPPLQRDGSNAFTYSRFLVPILCRYQGWALFVDGVDMLARTDLNAIMAHANPRFAALVVKHDYRTRHPRKYLGTAMECANEDYPRKNWSSVILWNCGHDANRHVNLERPSPLHHRFPWIADRELGALPAHWNWLADEYGENPEAAIAHWTAGHPGFAHYANAPMAGEWHALRARIGS
jgi:hypothetical protein